MIEYENLGKLNLPFFLRTKGIFVCYGKRMVHFGVGGFLFESEFASYCGSKYCTGLASGLDALILALKAFDFKPGTEVIVPSNTYIATILAVLQAGLKPVLVEPDIHTYNIDPAKIEQAIQLKPLR